MPNDAKRQSMQMAYYDEALTTIIGIKNKTTSILFILEDNINNLRANQLSGALKEKEDVYTIDTK